MALGLANKQRARYIHLFEIFVGEAKIGRDGDRSRLESAAHRTAYYGAKGPSRHVERQYKGFSAPRCPPVRSKGMPGSATDHSVLTSSGSTVVHPSTVQRERTPAACFVACAAKRPA